MVVRFDRAGPQSLNRSPHPSAQVAKPGFPWLWGASSGGPAGMKLKFRPSLAEIPWGFDYVDPAVLKPYSKKELGILPVLHGRGMKAITGGGEAVEGDPQERTCRRHQVDAVRGVVRSRHVVARAPTDHRAPVLHGAVWCQRRWRGASTRPRTSWRSSTDAGIHAADQRPGQGRRRAAVGDHSQRGVWNPPHFLQHAQANP